VGEVIRVPRPVGQRLRGEHERAVTQLEVGLRQRVRPHIVEIGQHLDGGRVEGQQALVTKAIEAWVDNVNLPAASRLVATYKRQYAQTRIAWSGSLDPTVQGAYFRIQGPRVWIEIVSQPGVVFHNQVHYHSIWRDHSTDYGA